MQRGKPDDCVLCCRDFSIYAIGICDHPVCYECSTRLRVLGRKKECPICRQNLPKVIFVKDKLKFAFWDKKFLECDVDSAVFFQNKECKEAFYKLLEYVCNICRNSHQFESFVELKDHMRREHERFYCDLCVTNIMLFTVERRAYQRSELAQHRRCGDSDDKSHRGHPLCEFCDERYMDEDDLFRHLRKDHYFCHFCDADGQHVFYNDYNSLRDHFRNGHYICEEGACANEQFTSVFRSDIDFKSHKSMVHNKNLTKAQVKQARTIEVEFSLTPRLNRQIDMKGNSTNCHANKAVPEKNIGWQVVESESLSNSQVKTDVVKRDSTPLDLATDFPSLGEEKPDQGKNIISAWQSAKKKGYSPSEINAAFPALAPSSVPFISKVWREKKTENTTGGLKNNAGKCKAETHIKPSNTSYAPNKADVLENGATNTVKTTDNPVEHSWNRGTKKKCVTTYLDGDESCSMIRETNNLSIDDFPELISAQNDSLPSVGNKQKNNVWNGKTQQKTAKSHSKGDNNSEKRGFQSLASTLKPDHAKGKKSNNVGKTKCIEPHGNIRNASHGRNTITGNSIEFEQKNGNLNLQSKTNIEVPSLILSNASSISSDYNLNRSGNYSEYLSPDNFQQRNVDLIKKIQNLMNRRKSSFADFKLISGQFRKSLITAENYYAKCTEMIGEKDFDNIFPELLALLPDIKKQNDLLKIYTVRGKYPDIEKFLKICMVCTQVLAFEDFFVHQLRH